MRAWRTTCGLLAAIAVLGARAAGAEPAALEAVLAEPILPAGEPLREVRAFIAARVPEVPRAADREAWEAAAGRVRRDMLEQVVFRGSARAWREADCRVEWLDTIDGGPGYRIRKFRYECLPGMWIPALLYVPDRLEGRVPVAINVNGHAPEGKAVAYKQLRAINLAKRGMLALNLEWFGMGQLRTAGFSHYRMNQLDLCGAGGLAPFYLALERVVDVAVALEHADAKRVAVAGLSGGGWQTILISSLDTRVALANPVAGYGGFRSNILFDDMGDSEQAPTDMGLVADYTHLTALRAPRPTLLTYNAGDDCCFKSGHALEPLLAAARPAFALYGAEAKLRSHVNHVPGTHNFERENREQLYAAIGDFFYPGDARYVREEIESQGEIKTAAALQVPLPADNLDFHRLAVRLMEALPPRPALPTSRSAAEAWQGDQRDALRALLKVPQYEAAAKSESAEGGARRWKLTMGEWTVPAVELDPSPGDAPRAAIVVADSGRATMADECRRLRAAGYRVVAVDPFLWGESKIKAQDPDYTYPLMVAAMGQRPLGIQAGQLAAIARWLKARGPAEEVTIAAHGPRSCIAALVAAAVEPSAIGRMELHGGPSTLRMLIEDDQTVESAPELFAYGLLRTFDVRELIALAAPREVVLREPDDRARRELAPLAAWYGVLGAKFELSR